MIKYFLSFFIALFIFGCGGSSTTTTTTNTLIEECAQDTNISAVAIASVPHTKSSIPMLGILVNYTNQTITSDETTWSNKLFGKSEHQLNHYYQEVSNLYFEFTQVIESSGFSNDGIISITLNKDHPDTATDNPAFADNVYPDLKNALIAADSSIDFSNYDSDGNGNITPDELILTFIIAGQEDAYAGAHVTNGIWAHENCMEQNSNVPTLDGVTLMSCINNGNFALFGERHDTHDATIGIIAHESGHSTFQLPDLYNTNGSDGGIGYFGLMGGGTWGRINNRESAGDTPTHFTAWSKVYMQWYTPSENKGFITLNETSSSAYNIEKFTVNANCYYLFENRNNSGYDRGLFTLNGTFNGGMAVWKINNTKLTTTNFELNNVNADTQNKGVDLVEAQYSTIDTQGDAGDEDALFYDTNQNSFGTIFSNVSARGTTMSLDVN